jgi:hypothetical protein
MSTGDVDTPPNVGSVTTLALTTVPCDAVRSAIDGLVGSVGSWSQAAATTNVVNTTTRARHTASGRRTVRMRCGTESLSRHCVSKNTLRPGRSALRGRAA